MREAFFDEGAGLDYDMNVWCDPAVLTTDVEMVTYMLEVQTFLDDCNDYNKKDAEAAVRTFFRPCSDRTMMKRAVKMMRKTIVNAVFD